jgi:hypothetical protein
MPRMDLECVIPMPDRANAMYQNYFWRVPTGLRASRDTTRTVIFDQTGVSDWGP